MKLTHRTILAAPLLGAAAFLATSCSAPVEETAPISQAAPAGAPQAQPVAATENEGIGKTAPDFTLTDSNGKSHKLSDFRGKHVVLEWLNPDCPFVKKHYGSGNMQKLQKEATAQGVVWLSIVSSAPGNQGNYPPAEHNKLAKEKGANSTAILLDADGTVGKLYRAKTTPHMFVIGPKGEKLYDGAIDDKPTADQADVKGAKNYVMAALKEAKAGKKVTNPTTQPYGCSVKY